MKRFYLLLLLILVIPSASWAVTNMTCAAGSCEWNTAGNWSDGVPDATKDATFTAVAAGTTITITTTAAAAKSIDFSGAGAFTLTGSVSITVSGSLTLKTGMTYSETGQLVINATGTITSNSVNLGSISSLRITNGGTVQLSDAINTGTKPIYVDGASTVFQSNNNQIDCGPFANNNVAGAITLTMGSSTINCTAFNWEYITPTVTANTATVNIIPQVANPGQWVDFGSSGTSWGGTVTINNVNNVSLTLYGANTFGNLTLIFPASVGYPSLGIESNQTISGTLTINATSGNRDATDRGSNRSMIYGGIPNSYGVQKTITFKDLVMTAAAGTCTIDFRDIKLSDSDDPSGTVDLSAYNTGNLGGNSQITFRTATTYYATSNNFSVVYSRWPQDYDNIWTVTLNKTTPDGTGVFPLPQDTIVFNDTSWADAGYQFFFHAGGRTGNVDTSALTRTLEISLPRYTYGDLIYTGSNLTVVTNTAYTFDARLKNETGGDTLDLNITPTITPVGETVTMNSLGGTVKLLSAFKMLGTFIFTRGTLNLNGQTFSVGVFSSSNTNTRTIQDLAGGGKIVLTGLTGTIFDLDVGATITISNAPAIDIGDSTKTLTGDVTFEGGGKTYGNLSIKKHAGNFDAIITGANTFGTITLETPDITYQYSDIQFPPSVTTTCTGFSAITTRAGYPINISSSTHTTQATVSDGAGTNVLEYITLHDIAFAGGAIWKDTAGGNSAVNLGNNTGIEFVPRRKRMM